MAEERGVAVIGADLVVTGEIRNCRVLEVFGVVRGPVQADHVRVHPGGVVAGAINAGSAEINGEFQGEAAITSLIAIGAEGRVNGKVRYGRLALAEGGELVAEVRNIPPKVAGDFQITVRQGRSVRLTTEDVTAIDPDDTSQSLVFSVSRPVNGYLALVDAPARAVERFTQAELEGGRVLFVHSGPDASPASFDVVVADKAGEKSGAPRTVSCGVIATP